MHLPVPLHPLPDRRVNVSPLYCRGRARCLCNNLAVQLAAIVPARLKRTPLYRFTSLVYHLGPRGSLSVLRYKCLYVWAVIRAGSSKTILFYPEVPHPSHVLYKIAHILGCKATQSLGSSPTLVIHYQDTTKRVESEELVQLGRRYTVVNGGSHDISKECVESVFSDVFGRSTFVDPQEFCGPCVMKSSANGKHDGNIVQCPVSAEKGYIYQRLINNEVVGDGVLDIRVPVIGASVPFVYLKYRAVSTRFSNTNTRVDIANTADVLSPAECAKILAFSRLSGLDYGEIDIVRDTGDGLLYILDVNNTPSGPPNHLSQSDHRMALAMLSRGFQDEFLREGPSVAPRSASLP